MFPRIVERATEPPGKCAVTGDIDGPFIDTGKDIVDPSNPNMIYRIYLHVPYVQQLARDLAGMTEDGDIEELESQLEVLDAAFNALARKEVV